LPKALGSIISELTEGWEASEARLHSMTGERDMWRRKAHAVEKELSMVVERHRTVLSEVRVRAACDLAAIRSDIKLDEHEILLLANWKKRAENLNEELNSLNASHQRLMKEHRELKLDYEREKIAREREHAAAVEKLTRERDEFKQKWEASRAEAQRWKGEADRWKEQAQRLQAEIPPLKAEAADAKSKLPVVERILQIELRLDERQMGLTAGMIEAAEDAIRREYQGYIACLVVEIPKLEDELVSFDKRFHDMRRSMSEELEWQRSENRKVKLLVDGARRTAEEAARRLAEVEAHCKQLLEQMQAELDRTIDECKNQVAQMLTQLLAEQEEHQRTKRQLDDEKHARAMDAIEMQRLADIAKLAVERATFAGARAEKAETALEKVQLEAADTERELKDHLATCLEQFDKRLEAEQAYLKDLDRLTTALDGADELKNLEWQGKLDDELAKYAALKEDRDELQARYDWVLVRFTGREPREQDVAMMSRLQEELSRQMHMTAAAVQTAREYKEALRTNDAAYTRLFGQGSLRSDDYVSLHNELKEEDILEGRRPPSAARSSRPQSAKSVRFDAAPGRPPSSAGSRPTSPTPNCVRPLSPKAILGGLLPTALRVAGPPDDIAMAQAAAALNAATAKVAEPLVPLVQSSPPEPQRNIGAAPCNRPALTGVAPSPRSPRTRMGAAMHRPAATRIITAPIVRPCSARPHSSVSKAASAGLYNAPGGRAPNAVTMPPGARSMEEALVAAAETAAASRTATRNVPPSMRPQTNNGASLRPWTAPGAGAAEGKCAPPSIAESHPPIRQAHVLQQEQQEQQHPTPPRVEVAQVIAQLVDAPISPREASGGWDTWDV